MTKIDYFQNYPQEIRDKVDQLITSGQLRSYLLKKYPTGHQVNTDKQLYEYANNIKQSYMKNSPPK